MSRPRTESEYLASLVPPSVAAAGISRRGFLKGTLGTGAACPCPACSRPAVVATTAAAGAAPPRR